MRTKTVNQPSKMVTDRMQSCEAVLWALETHGARLVEILGEQFAPFLGEGLAMPFETQLELFKNRLTHDRDELVEASRELRIESARETNIRSARDAEMKVVFNRVVRLRRLIQGAYDDEQLNDLGFTRQTSQLPAELLEQAVHLSRLLRAPDLELPSSAFGTFELDVPALTQEFEPAVGRLRQSMSDLARQVRLTEVAQLAKNGALEKYNSTFLWIARTVESLLRLAGLDEVAERVRPSSRRRGVTEVKFEKPEEDGAKPDSDGDAPNDTDAPQGNGGTAAEDQPSPEGASEAEPVDEASA